MGENNVNLFIKEVLANMPSDWLNLTTHRLDIYNESQAKFEFLDEFERLANANNSAADALAALPTAYDYIRLGHPLSCVLEWGIAKLTSSASENVISFSSHSTPILAVLRSNLLKNKRTQIAHQGSMPASFDAETIRRVYGYDFNLVEVDSPTDIPAFDGTSIFFSTQTKVTEIALHASIDFYIAASEGVGSILVANGVENATYVPDIQHVRRRETIAMTPASHDACKLCGGP